MAKSTWVYKKLRNFRAGIEANISTLKRAFGLDRCTWKGWEGFKSYVWSSIFAYNLQVIARIKLEGLKSQQPAMQNHLTGVVRHKIEKEQIKLVTG